MGESPTESKSAWSLELCGGTHVSRTGDIGLVAFSSESAVGSGVRRIEALTGESAQLYLLSQEKQLRQASDLLKVVPSDITKRIGVLLDERKVLQRDLTQAQKQMALGGGDNAPSDAEEINGIKFKSQILENVGAKDLKGLCDQHLQSLGDAIVVLASKSDDGKAAIVVAVSKNLTKSYDAVELVRSAAEILGGKGRWRSTRYGSSGRSQLRQPRASDR